MLDHLEVFEGRFVVWSVAEKLDTTQQSVDLKEGNDFLTITGVFIRKCAIIRFEVADNLDG